MIRKAFGKVNLALDVIGKRDDGFHELDMVMAPISLYDLIEITPAAKDEIICQGMDLPEENTLSKMLKAIRSIRDISNYRIEITKHIPEQSGLGGGSADAAALLEMIDELEGLNLSMDEKMALAASVGSDVPFFLVHGFARVKGRGEIVEPIESDWQIPMLLIKPEQGVSTKACFDMLSENPRLPKDIDIVENAVKKQDIALLYQTMVNALEEPAFQLVEQLDQLCSDCYDLGLIRVVMSGSGSTLMGFHPDQEDLEAAAKMLRQRGFFVWETVAGKQS